ncbi:MAG TPA: hypothetical protein VHX17_12790 [Candidatus Cybelea sp.]|nr:hypothetical protein [Candidatus Cybelea sp.]
MTQRRFRASARTRPLKIYKEAYHGGLLVHFGVTNCGGLVADCQPPGGPPDTADGGNVE